MLQNEVSRVKQDSQRTLESRNEEIQGLLAQINMLKDKNDVDSVVKTWTEKLKMKDEEIERIQSDFDGQKKIIADLTSTIDKQMSKLKESKQRLQSQKNVMLAKQSEFQE